MPDTLTQVIRETCILARDPYLILPRDPSSTRYALIIANRILFPWLTCFWGGHSFLYTSAKHFADTVNAFLQEERQSTD